MVILAVILVAVTLLVMVIVVSAYPAATWRSTSR